ASKSLGRAGAGRFLGALVWPVQNGGARDMQGSEGNCGPPICRKSEYGRNADSRIPLPYYCDSDDDVVPKRPRNSAPGRRDARAADSKIYRTSAAKINKNLGRF